MAERWNHNIHYQRLILRELGPGAGRVLDVGCGEGLLALELSRTAERVTAIDLDQPTVELARRGSPAPNVDYLVADLMTHPFEPSSYDAVVSVAALHHMDMGPALARMAELLRPGGTLAVVGLARSRIPQDLPFDLAGAVKTRLHRARHTYWESSAPKIWPPPLTYADVRRVASAVLPGARYRRLALWRYWLSWTRPHQAGAAPLVGPG